MRGEMLMMTMELQESLISTRAPSLIYRTAALTIILQIRRWRYLSRFIVLTLAGDLITEISSASTLTTRFTNRESKANNLITTPIRHTRQKVVLTRRFLEAFTATKITILINKAHF